MLPQSATSITDFKNCPTLYYLRHVLRLRPVEDADTLRVGTNWHRCLEILTGPDGGRDALIAHLNEAYETCPPSVSLIDWEVERTVLLYSALGWDWYYQDDQIETVAREVHFDRQINNQYRRRGKIDRIIINNRGMNPLMLGEYKSTTKPIDPGSLYWDRLNLDSQLTLYLIEARHAQLAGKLKRYGISATDPLISGVLYDVWHKPTIRPKKLSMADSKKFVENGEYFGEKFAVYHQVSGGGSVEAIPYITVNENAVEVTPGKKEGTFAIRETPEMFGARLLADIRENPEKHFARKPIARTDEELARLDKEYYNLARVAHFMEQRNLWFVNENHCTATYRCSFTPICFYNVDVSNGQVPNGFKCLKRKK